MYVLLFSIARNIVFVVIVISHDYSLLLSKLFCLKGSLNLKERRGYFLVVFCESCTFKMVQANSDFLKIYLVKSPLVLDLPYPLTSIIVNL